MIQIKEIVNSIFTSKTYILFCEGEDKAWLVDIGDVEPVVTFLEEKGLTVEGVFLTHAHFDHIYGLPELIESFPDCKIYTNESGRETLADARLNMSLYHEKPMTFEGPQVQICGEGDDVPIFQDIIAKIYETPGHHPSCLTIEVKNYMFTGDAYIPGVEVVTNLPKGNKKLAKESIVRILKMAQDKQICPGHKVNEI